MIDDEETLRVYEECGRNQVAAAKALGIVRATFQSRLREALRRQKDKSVNNLDPLVPDGQKLKGVSTLYGADGVAKNQWVKTEKDLERQLEMLKDAAEAMVVDIPKEKRIKEPKSVVEELASVYVLTDYHLGQLSIADECSGEKWNTELATDFLVNWFAKAIKSSPDSDTAVLCQLGDFLHYDSMSAITPMSGNLLDTDSRYSELVGIAVTALRRIINMLLKKHKHVHIVMAEGNHDMTSSIWLRALFADKYSNNPRVTVDSSKTPFYMLEWGLTSLFFHHGHKMKMAGLSKVLASMFRSTFGRTKYSYAHTGHLHHVEQKEDGLMIVEQHPTMAAKDAYSTRGGYVSNRGASVITYSKTFGEVSRITIRPEMIK
ncbi:metallophosphoesterase [Candidatus Pacearchaeota archaeon]|nr:metallophosphoesterase [Candidatus Pacearchaeota archaeon]